MLITACRSLVYETNLLKIMGLFHVVKPLIQGHTQLRWSNFKTVPVYHLLLVLVFWYLLSTTRRICPKYGEIQTGMYFFCTHRRPGTMDNEWE